MNYHCLKRTEAFDSELKTLASLKKIESRFELFKPSTSAETNNSSDQGREKDGDNKPPILLR